MFNKNGKSHPFYTILILTTLILAGGYLFSDNGKNDQNTALNMDPVTNNTQQVYEPNTTPEDHEKEQNKVNNELPNENDSANDPLDDLSDEDGSYLIEEKNEKIVIYFIDDFGAKQFIQQTDIPYELLSEGDQEMFHKGIELQSLTEVYELLQDFES